MSEEIRTKVEVEVVVPGDWVEYATKYNDLLSRDYIGYWAFGVKQDAGGRGWLLYVHPTDPGKAPGPKAERLALERWESGGPLPRYFYRLDVEAMKRAYAEGCKRYGVDWYESKGDATTYDVAVQLALLGDIVYG